MVFIDEHVSHRQHNRTRVNALKDKNKRNGYRVEEWYGDPAGKAMSAQTQMSTIDQFGNYGIYVIGIRSYDGMMSELFDFREALGGIAEKPRIFVNVKRCPHLTESLENYAKDEKGEKPRMNQPWDHACDAARYGFRAQGRGLRMKSGFGKTDIE